MLTKLTIRNFKLFTEAEIELGERVVFVGPNNAGKTSALQALALWSYGVRRWVERRGAGNVPKERAGVTINRRDLIGLPIPSANLLWRDLHVREGYREANRQKTRNVPIEIAVEGVDHGQLWIADLEFDYANEESFYCRSRLSGDGSRKEVPKAAADLRLAYLPPMSGLAANETRLDEGAIGVRIGEGRTAEVLRNLCWLAQQRSNEDWRRIVERMQKLFGVTLDDPEYIKERGEIVMAYRTGGTKLDLSACGRGQQQTLLLLAHMAANPGAVLLLDEPDAHLEILRQRQIYDLLTDTAQETRSQIIAASHSEVILNEASGRDMVVAFVGRPHRIDDRGSQVAKALKEIGFDQYLQAQATGWVLYLEGSTDLAILRAFAHRLEHPAQAALDRPFVHYVANQPGQARHHFYGLREAVPALQGFALFDRLDNPLQRGDPSLTQRMWQRCEIENYLCQRDTLLAWARAQGDAQAGALFASTWSDAMASAIEEVSAALATLGRPDPWSTDVKASEDFLQPVLQKFFDKLGLPNLMRKTDYHTLAPYVAVAAIDAEIRNVLDDLHGVARRGQSAEVLS
ncbi:MAG TPA: AAA family ATPase [Gammaproteobacteria bacterium]|nr:AAA family ATPase [Gammaproteobacteria bacterium]